nr:major centromere autoantigen B-like [Rhipicephalus microplus]
MGIDDFTASNGWLWRFRKGFGLGRCERLSSAKQRAAVSSERTRREPEDFLAYLDAREQYHPRNPDSDGDPWSPTTLAVVGQRVGVILGVNEDCSDNLAPRVVGRRIDPKNLRNLCSPPCVYLASTEDLSRMPVGALEQYLDVLDRRMRAGKRVVAVFLTPDVAEAVSSDFKNTRLFSLRCSSMSSRNSSDVSILKHFKQLYRTFLLRRFTVLNGQLEEARPTLLFAMSLITMSWDCLKQDIIRTAFKDWGFHGCILSHSAAAEPKQGDAAGHAVDTGNVLLDSFVWTD